MNKCIYRNISIKYDNPLWKMLDLVNLTDERKKKLTKQFIDIFYVCKNLNNINNSNLKEKEKIKLISKINSNNKHFYNLKQAKIINKQMKNCKQIGGGKKYNSNLITLLLFPLWKIEKKIPITTKLFDSISEMFQKSKIISQTVSPLIESLLALSNMGGNLDLIEKVLDEVIILIAIMYNFSRKHIVIASIDAFQHFPLISQYVSSLDYSIKNDIRTLEKTYKKDAVENIEKVSDLLDNILEIITNVEISLGNNYQKFKEKKIEMQSLENN